MQHMKLCTFRSVTPRFASIPGLSRPERGGVKGRLRRPLRGFALDPAPSGLRRPGIEVKAEDCEMPLALRCRPVKNGTAVTEYLGTLQGWGSNRPENPLSPAGVVESACAEGLRGNVRDPGKRWWVAATNRGDLKWSVSGRVEVGGAYGTEEAG